MREGTTPHPGSTLHLLGTVRLPTPDGDGCPKGRKARALLGYLAVAPDGSEGRERLADLLWTDRGAEQARGSLRQALAEIRRCAPDAASIEAGRERVSLDRDRLPTDVDRIRAAAAARRAPDLAAAAEGIGGPFLDGMEGLSPGYDEWLHAERPRQHERVVAAVLDAAPDMIGGGGTADMQAVVRGLERLEPLNEAVARLGMRVDHEARDLASLHRRFRRLEEGIGREFASPPSEETRRLFARLAASSADEPAPATAASAGPAASKPPTVIVAPIEAAGGGDADDLAALCTEDVRAALARLPHLRVVALDTPDEERLAAACEGAVGVYLLSGRLRAIGTEAVATLRIGHVGDGVILWSEQLRVSLADLFDAMERVVERAAGAVTPSIDRDLSARLDGRSSPSSADAAMLFTEARLRMRPPRSLSAFQQAVALLERVVELDPTHVPALTLLGRMYNTDFWQQMAGHDVEAFQERADRLFRKAALIAPSDPALMIFRAWCHLRRREWRTAELGFERAAAARPHDADAAEACATGLCLLGEIDRAEPLFQRAFRLNPFPPADYHADWALMLALRGEADEAEEHFAVSGEQGLPYRAVRLANLARGGGRDAARADAFVRGFRTAWRPERAPTIEDLLGWLDHTLPLQRPEHRAFVREGLAAAVSETFRP